MYLQSILLKRYNSTMQTFLPHATNRDSLDALDNKRLNKQILECYQILNILTEQSQGTGWRNHPAVLMWKGSEEELFRYAFTAVELAKMRGINVEKNRANLTRIARNAPIHTLGDDLPIWLNNPTILKLVNTTHKANLYRKDPIYYAEYAYAVYDKYNKPCCDSCQYYWPTHKEKNV